MSDEHSCPVTYQDPPERGYWLCECGRAWVFYVESGWMNIGEVKDGIMHAVHPSRYG